MAEKRKIVLYISMSLDGFIADENDDLSFLSMVESEGEDYGYFDFIKTVDTYIVGRKTYSKIMELVGEFPQAKTHDCYIITRQNIPNQESLTFYNGDISDLIQTIRQSKGKDIYCDGGGEIVKLLMDNQLIDRFIISVIPTILGKGKRLFIGDTKPNNLKLVSTKAFEKGLVQLQYERI